MVHSLFGALFIVITLANSPLAAAELLVWTSQTRALALSDAQVAEDKARGVRGYMLGRGGFPFNAASLTKQEAKLKPFVERVHAQGMEVGLRLNLANYHNASTPLAPWFDDGAEIGPGKAWIKWNHDYTDPINGEKRLGIITQTTLFGEMCRRLDIDEVIFDQEEYPGGHTKALGGQRCSWMWNYPADLAQEPNWTIPANTHTEAETRAKARERGRQMMQALVKAFPGVNVGVYYNRLAGTQWEWEFTHYYRKPNPSPMSVAVPRIRRRSGRPIAWSSAARTSTIARRRSDSSRRNMPRPATHRFSSSTGPTTRRPIPGSRCCSRRSSGNRPGITSLLLLRL